MGIAWAYICKFTSFPINHQTGLADIFFLRPALINGHTHTSASTRHFSTPPFLAIDLCSLFVRWGSPRSPWTVPLAAIPKSFTDIPTSPYRIFRLTLWSSLQLSCSNLLWPVIQVPYFPLPLLYQHRAFLFAFSLRSLCIIKFFRASPLLNSTFSHYHFSGHFLTLSSRFVSTNKKKPTYPHGQIGLGENNNHYFGFFISAYLYGKGIPFSYSRNCVSASIRLRLTGYSLHFHWFSWSFR